MPREINLPADYHVTPLAAPHAALVPTSLRGALIDLTRLFAIPVALVRPRARYVYTYGAPHATDGSQQFD